MADLSFVVFSQQDEVAQHLRRALEACAHVSVLSSASSESEFSAAVRKSKPDVLLVDLGHAPHAVLDLLDTIPAPRPQLIACGPQDQSDVILRALKQGAREFLPTTPEAEEIETAVKRLVLELAPSANVEELAPLLAVMGAKGGVGATVVACQLAASLQQAGSRTVIVDLNIPLGDVALHFDVQPSYTMADIARDGEQIDATLIQGLLQRHETGLHILAAPSRMEEAELVADSHVHSVLKILKREFDWVIVDVSRSWTESTVRALDLADEILLVTLQDVPTLTHARAHRELLLRLGHSPKKIHTVVNRASKRDLVSKDDLVEFLDSQPTVLLPNDYATTVTCVNEGRPVSQVAANSDLDRAFQQLAEEAFRWVGLEMNTSAPRNGGVWSRFIKLLARKR